MLQWMKRPYFADNAAGKHRKIRRKVERGEYVPGLYLITESQKDGEQLEILENGFLLQPDVRKTLPRIVGAAYGKEHAVEVIARIAEDCMMENGDCDLKRFIRLQE